MTTRIAQLSDTHFLAEGDEFEGGFGYDTSAAFESVASDIAAHGHDFDLITVTGDIADHGRGPQYEVAAAALAGLGSPVNVTPGNHDRHAAFTAGIGRPAIATNRVVRLANWCHLFVDSCAGVLRATDAGHLVDPQDYEQRLHTNGSLGERETAWIREQAAETDADHVFIWLHHPPASSLPLAADDAYTSEWQALVPDLTRLRGIAGGHTHMPDDYEFEGVPVFVSPALKNNFDLQAQTVLPPGYRTYEFGTDGSVSSDLRLLDDDRWPRVRYGAAVHALLTGELSFAEFDEIMARRRAERA